MTYPDNWPRCLCGAAALDGHLTCGRASCSESEARDQRARLAPLRPWICRGCNGRTLHAGTPQFCAYCRSPRLYAMTPR